MYCEHCGEEVKGTQKFCPQCGAERGIKKTSTLEARAAPSTPPAVRGPRKVKSKGAAFRVGLVALVLGIVLLLGGIFLIVGGTHAMKEYERVTFPYNTKAASEAYNDYLNNKKAKEAGTPVAIAGFVLALMGVGFLVWGKSSGDCECPYCAKRIKAEATICPYCRSTLPKLTPRPPRLPPPRPQWGFPGPEKGGGKRARRTTGAGSRPAGRPARKE